MTALVTDGLAFWAGRSPDRPAIVFDGTDTLSYAALQRWSDAAGHYLMGKGLRSGDRVGIIGSNSLEWVVAALGALKVGAVVVPLNNRFCSAELRYLFEDTTPRLVLTDDAASEVTREAVAGTRTALVGLGELSGLRHSSPQQLLRVCDAHPDDVTQIVYTSGTTSKPKGVIFTHRTTFNLIADLSLSDSNFRSEAKILYVLSMAGAPGLLWHILHPITRGMTVYYERRFDPVVTLNRLANEKIDIFCGVPLLFDRMAAQPEFVEADLSSLSVATIAGAPAATSTIKVWLEKGVRLRQAYGMTELGGVSSINPVEQALVRPHSIGRGSVYNRMRVVRPDGSDCAPGEHGEIVIAGPAITPGYWGNPQAYDEVMCDGWFHSGDVGVVDEEGWLQVVDRMKDIIITGGFNVAPSEIEAVIAEIDGVVDVCVIPAHDAKFGEAAAAIVHAAGEVTAQSVFDHCRQRLAGYKQPAHVVMEAAPLPRMISGKISRRQIRDLYPHLNSATQPIS
ncbi:MULTISPECIES: class I adenylate-forming enzyme family protein [unclassified Mycolicibacterium]|uniref:class I adenylate-forming enzyme family protein n=1 Tax=unclassified Mycolicibacterium TaxID=2636767 RepID=UPI0013914A80|nr:MULTISPECIES: AMP-binding protein [unclassified Mycolicibacterium]